MTTRVVVLARRLSPTRRPREAPQRHEYHGRCQTIGGTPMSIATLGRPTHEELLGLIDDGSVDTVILAITDMQGRLQGKRIDAQVLRQRDCRRGRRGLQLSARLRRRHAHGRGLRPHVVGERLRRHRLQARLLDDPDGALAREDRHRLRRRRDRPRRARRGLAAPDPHRPVRPARDPGWTRLSPGPSWSSSSFADTYEEAWSSGYRNLTPGNQYNVDYSLQGTSAHRAAARAHAPRHA